MNLSLALPKTTETLSISAGLEGVAERKTADEEGVDGFAALLDTLASMVAVGPTASDEAATTVEARQYDGRPTGKILPLPASELPVELAGNGGTAKSGHGATIAPLTSATLAIMPQVTEAATGQIKNSPDGAPASLALSQSAPPPAPQSGADMAANAKSAEQMASEGKQPVSGLQVRIAAASEPHGARSADPVAVAQASQVNPGAERLAPVAVAFTIPVATAPAKAEGAAAAGPQATTASAGESANPEPGSSDDKPAGERRTVSPQVLAVPDLPKPVATGVVMSFEDAFSIAHPAAAAPRPVVTDPFTNVERVIEHLNAARQFDLSKPASISVAHREFGALTVTFDQTEKGMNVEIAAENRDAQRALAAAMVSERGTARQQDGGAQNFFASNQHGASSADRGGSNGNAGTTAGQNHGGNNNEHRSHHSEQRGRQAERTLSSSQSPSPKLGDEGLYA